MERIYGTFCSILFHRLASSIIIILIIITLEVKHKYYTTPRQSLTHRLLSKKAVRFFREENARQIRKSFFSQVNIIQVILNNF